MTKAQDFFYANAGYSYPSGTPATDRAKFRAAHAADLASAEAQASSDGASFVWRVDEHADRSGIEHASPLWVCVMYSQDGKVLASLGSVDFGAGNDPWGQSYRRVVEAELAVAAFTMH